ncbi:MAG TPA: hypothetical protein PKV33_09000 [Methanothrix sp.]|nr:hypothetical protein [Methanothrix sp.]
MKAAMVLCRFFRLLFPFVLLLFLLLFLPPGLSGMTDSSFGNGPHLEVSSIRGNLEDGRPSSIFVVLKNNASPSKDPVEPAFDRVSARNILAELESSDEKIKIYSGRQNAGLLAAGENATVQFMALTDGADLGIYPLQLRCSYTRLSQVAVSGTEAAPNFAFSYERASQEQPLQVKVMQGPKIEQENLEGETLPGAESILKIVLANRGDLPAADIQMQARPTDPFLMVLNGQENVSLAPGESAPMSLSVFTDENATSGYYALPCRISYREEQDEEIRKQDLAVLIYVGKQSSIPWMYLLAGGLIMLLLAGGLFGLRRFLSSYRRIRIVKS